MYNGHLFQDGFEDNEYYKKPIYGLSDFNAGWFLHMEMRKKKLWYWGALKRRFAYFWEMLKVFGKCILMFILGGFPFR